MRSKLTWEWTFPSGELVMATLEFPSMVESVFLGQRLLSRSPPGGQRKGHVFTLAQGETRVDFDPATRQCALTQGGAMLPPTRVASPTSSMSAGTIIALVLGGLVVFASIFGALAVYGVRKYKENLAASADTGPFTQTYKSTNGLLVAHYPADFAATVPGENVLQLMRGGLRDDSILLMSIPHPISTDPAELGRVVVKPIVDLFAKKGSYRELSSGPADCLGHPGYATSGIATLSLETVNTWSCTFTLQTHGYIVFMSVNKDFATDDALLHRIVDATEIVGAGSAKKGP